MGNPRELVVVALVALPISEVIHWVMHYGLDVLHRVYTLQLPDSVRGPHRLHVAPQAHEHVEVGKCVQVLGPVVLYQGV